MSSKGEQVDIRPKHKFTFKHVSKPDQARTTQDASNNAAKGILYF